LDGFAHGPFTQSPHNAYMDTLTEATESQLIAQAICGDESAFNSVYTLYHDRIYRYVLSRVHRGEDAADLTQIVFLHAWKALGRYRPTGAPFVAWLTAIAHNVVMSFFRRRHHPEFSIDEAAFDVRSEVDVEHLAEIQMSGEHVQSAIKRLRPAQQTVIQRRFLDNVPYSDLAESLGKSEGAIRITQHRALLALRQALQREDDWFEEESAA